MSHPAGAVHDDAPPAPAPLPTPQSARASSALASAALGLGIAAFVTGWAPFLGAILGAAAVCVALIALSRGQSKPQAITGLALGVVGFVVSLMLSLGTLALVAIGPDAREQFVSGFLSGQTADAEGQGVAGSQDAADGEDETVPADESTRDVGGSVDTAAFTPLDAAGFAAATADPISVYGEQNVVYGEVQYIDETEWDCSALVLIDEAQQSDWEAYEVSLWAYESADVDCDELKELGELAHVALSITWRGSMTTEWDDGTVEDVLSGEVAHVEVLTPLP